MKDVNVLQLAYLGDTVYELYVREYLIDLGIVKVKELQTKSLKFVSAKRQSYYLKILIENHFLTEEELEIIRKGRNAKTHSKPKNCDIITYKYATAFEVLIGTLHRAKDEKRIKEIFEEIIKINEGDHYDGVWEK